MLINNPSRAPSQPPKLIKYDELISVWPAGWLAAVTTTTTSDRPAWRQDNKIAKSWFCEWDISHWHLHFSIIPPSLSKRAVMVPRNKNNVVWHENSRWEEKTTICGSLVTHSCILHKGVPSQSLSRPVSILLRFNNIREWCSPRISVHRGIICIFTGGPFTCPLISHCPLRLEAANKCAKRVQLSILWQCLNEKF